MKHPFRVWMTGSVAVVMAALGVGRSAMANDRHPLSQTSRFRLTDTVQRIEACAQRHGLSVFARLGHCAPQREIDEQSDDSTLIVFESADGGTPVLMEGPASQPEVPLAIWVRSGPAGGTEVLFADTDWDDLPPSVARDLTELPILVADALS